MPFGVIRQLPDIVKYNVAISWLSQIIDTRLSWGVIAAEGSGRIVEGIVSGFQSAFPVKLSSFDSRGYCGGCN
jgi:hypothetical protein